MPEPTIADVDALVGPATPHFAYQLRARVRELVRDLPPEHPVRRHADEQNAGEGDRSARPEGTLEPAVPEREPQQRDEDRRRAE